MLAGSFLMRSKWELRAEKELKSLGYIVDYKIRPSRVYAGAPIDYFHTFDLIAYKPGEQLRFISIKGKTYKKQHRIDIANFEAIGISKELWSYRKVKGKVERKILKI